jgi:hypothetical protein
MQANNSVPMYEDSNKVVYGTALLATLVFIALTDFWLSGVGLGLCLLSFLLFIRQLGRTIPILELMLLMASLQWILGAYISYRLNFEHFKYFMYVEEEEYMSIIVPGTVAFFLGVLAISPSYNFQSVSSGIKKLVALHPRLAYYLIVVGLFAPFLDRFFPAALGFVFFLAANFKYIGVAMILFQENSRQKWRIFTIVMGLTLLASLRNGMFHDLLLWSALMFSFVALKVKMRFFTKIALAFAGMFFAFLLQGIKSQYRDMVAMGMSSSGERVETFVDLMNEQISGSDNLFTESYVGLINVRLNQGWIISAIFDNVPAAEPYAEGETITEAFYASLVPRILDADKKIAGGRDNFERFTGLYLGRNASMGTSVIGEGYANYGKEGSWVFMLLWGIFLALIYKFLIRYGRDHPIIYLCLPLIFLQVIKAETELYVVLNHLVKSMMFIFLVIWSARSVLRLKL